MGGEPFRLTAPVRPPGGVVPRHRLVDRLRCRWSHRLVTIVAGPGFGKTTLLAAALADEARHAHDRDVWLACEPADEDANFLLAGLASAAGVGRVADADDLLRAIWTRAPARTSFVCDDVHEIPDGSPGAQLLAELCARLPRNASIVLSSRERPPRPVPLVRIAASGQHVGIVEADLLFTDEELDAFAALREIDGALLRESGGWPALAELTAAASAELVVEYAWDVVLERVGHERGRHLAQLAVVDGGDREVVDELVGRRWTDAHALVAGVPLIDVRSDGWIVPHRLWEPIARRVLTPDDVRAARVAAASVHLRRERFERAVDLLAEAEAWDDLATLIRHVALRFGPIEHWHRIGAWRRRLPRDRRGGPLDHLADGLELAARAPLEADGPFARAVEGFRRAGDAEAEIAAIERLGLVKWLAGDVVGLWNLHQRAVELAAAGVARAEPLTRIGDAGIAHLSNDPARVIEMLEPLGDAAELAWGPSILWLRHVAHRRLGDIERAELALGALADMPSDDLGEPQWMMCRARTDWLLGSVDPAVERNVATVASYVATEHRSLRTEAALEAAARLAWLGHRTAATRQLEQVVPWLDAAPGGLARILQVIAAAALAVDAGDETAARQLLVDEPLARPGLPESWYWCDRAAVALVHQLVPEDRAGWAAEARLPIHRLGVELSELLTAARAGDVGRARAMAWPAPGLVRAHLPARWIAELAAVSTAAGNPPPPELLHLLPSDDAARTSAGLEVLALGPLAVRIDGEVVDHPDLRRERVRELIGLLVAQPHRRRDELADLMWPDHPDPRHNLRVTLNYLRRVLEANGRHGSAGDYLRADHASVRLVAGKRLRCDVWEFDGHLAAAASAEHSGDPAAALASYARALALWRGPAFVDIDQPDELWDARQISIARVLRAATRAGELWLADDRVDDAMRAGELALGVDPAHEPALRLVTRGHLVAGDLTRAAAAIRAGVAAIERLGVVPGADTLDLVAEVERRR